MEHGGWQYALRHEPELPNCRKRWVLNQIINTTERALLLDVLLAHGCSPEDIIVRRVNLTKVAEHPQGQWLDVVTAQNEARNVAIDDGVALGATWILPFDGNHFITLEAWTSIVESAAAAESQGFKYFKVPVHRLHKEQKVDWVNARSKFVDVMPHAPIMIESQLAFHREARERFKAGMVYGQQNKLELLARACGEGALQAASQEQDGEEEQQQQQQGEQQQQQQQQQGERCGCQNLGVEGQPHKSDPEIAHKCGYSLRLWFYPCNGTDAHLVFYNGNYRKGKRSAGRRELARKIKFLIQHPDAVIL